MKCLLNYTWVKLPRTYIPTGKGIMAYWAKLAAHAAFRKGQALYCGYTNDIVPGMWAGGMVGLKSILGVSRRETALAIMDELTSLGYITYDIDPQTKKLCYFMTDWVCNCDGAACGGKSVYAIDGYGFLCVPRNLTERLVEAGHRFGEADAWLDLWCHSVVGEQSNAFSHLAPAIQFGKYGAIVTLETLGRRWGWEKTKVWRFFKKHGDAFALYRLPGNYGCVLFNRLYPTGAVGQLPATEQVMAVWHALRQYAERTDTDEKNHVHFNRIVVWYDAVVDGRYIFTHFDGDIARLVRFRDAMDDRLSRQCQVLCFPEQRPFLRSFLGEDMAIQVYSIETLEAALGK